MEKTKKILIVAGEASGDQHAANLIRELKAIYPGLQIWGCGGSRLKAQGVSLEADLVSLAVIGFGEVFRHLARIRAIFKQIIKRVDSDKPDLAILVDYPGFNLRLAGELSKRGIPVAYYISPQIWAWGGGRIRTIKKTVRRMIVFFEFEQKLYSKAGVDVRFVGHPSIEHVKPQCNREDFCRICGLDPARIIVSLLPGSRSKEVKAVLPVMLETARAVGHELKDKVQFVVLGADTLENGLIASIMRTCGIDVPTVFGKTYEGIAASDFAFVCSGTATLETAILKVPMVILYKVNFLTWLFMRMLIKIPYIGLVNVVRGRKIAQEFIQFDAKADTIAPYVIKALTDKRILSGLRDDLEAVRLSLGAEGASRRAAEAVAELLVK